MSHLATYLSSRLGTALTTTFVHSRSGGDLPKSHRTLLRAVGHTSRKENDWLLGHSLLSPRAPVGPRRFLGTGFQDIRSVTSMAANAGGLISSHGPDECIFCKIVRGEIPSYKLLETEHAVAFLDAFPMREGHVLLVPKKHAPFITDLSPEDAASSLRELPGVAQAVQKAYNAEGVSVAQNNGAPAGQVVFHVHFHIFPRESGDGLLKWSHGSKSMLSADEAKRVQEKIKQHI